MKLNIPTKGNKKLEKVMESVRNSKRLGAMWKCSNINSVDRLGFNDHGPVHVTIVANAALQILRLITSSGVEPGIVRDHKMSNEDAEVVVVLSALLHDIGMTVSRHNHEYLSIVLAPQVLPELISGYSIEEQVVIQSEVMHSLPHYSEKMRPYTIEAGILRIADALDMTKGRSRIPFESGKVNIHSVSAQAIDSVEITKGKSKPVRIVVNMNNSAGIFQIDELLKPRIVASGIREYIEVEAIVKGPEKQIVKKLVI